MIDYMIPFLLALFAALALTPLVRHVAIRIGAVDGPNERKIHTAPIPRLGGVSLFLSCVLTVCVLVGLAYLTSMKNPLDLSIWTPVFIGGAIVFLVGLWDDVWPIPPLVKFLFQATAAVVVMWSGILVQQISIFGTESLSLGLFVVPITFLWIIGVTNAFNLMDGLDGLSVGLASIAAGTSAAIFLLAGDDQRALFLLILLGALLGFLRYNFNPATIFLGDSGSLLVGYLLAVTAIMGSQKGANTLAVAIPLLIFGLPVIETLLSMLRRFIGELRLGDPNGGSITNRILSFKKMFVADQEHIHHRLIRFGFSHRNTVLLLYLIASILSLFALLSVLAIHRNTGIVLIVVGIATYIGIHKLGYREVAFLNTETLVRWYNQISFNQYFFLGFIDLLLITVSYWGSFVLKYDSIPTDVLGWYAMTFPIVLLIQLMVFAAFRLYKGKWRIMGASDAIRVSRMIVVAAVLPYAIVLVSTPPSGLIQFFIINFFILSVLIIGSRSVYRIMDYLRKQGASPGDAVLIYGAGRGGQLVVDELRHNPQLGLRPVAFLDDDPGLSGRIIRQLPVLGTGVDLPSIHGTRSVVAVVVSTRQITHERMQQLLDDSRDCRIAVLRSRFQLNTIETNGVKQIDGWPKMVDGHECDHSPLTPPDPASLLIDQTHQKNIL